MWDTAHEHSFDSPVAGTDSRGGDNHDDGEDVDMDAPGEKPAGKRPDFGPQANVHDGPAFSRDNRALTSASQDELIFVWDVVRVEKLKELKPSSALHSLVYTSDGS